MSNIKYLFYLYYIMYIYIYHIYSLIYQIGFALNVQPLRNFPPKHILWFLNSLNYLGSSPLLLSANSVLAEGSLTLSVNNYCCGLMLSEGMCLWQTCTHFIFKLQSLGTRGQWVLYLMLPNSIIKGERSVLKAYPGDFKMLHIKLKVRWGACVIGFWWNRKFGAIV